MIQVNNKQLRECTLEDLEMDLVINQEPLDGIVVTNQGQFIFQITYKMDDFGEYDFEECGYVPYEDEMGDIDKLEVYIDDTKKTAKVSA